MKSARSVVILAALVLPFLPIPESGLTAEPSAQAATPRVTLTAAAPITLPGTVYSNSPVVWDLEDGQYRTFVLTSSDGAPRVASGPSVDRLGATTDVTILPHPGHGVWMEAIVADGVPMPGTVDLTAARRRGCASA